MIIGKYKDGREFKRIVRRSTKRIDIEDDLISLDLSRVKNAESLQFIFYKGDFIDDVVLSSFDGCPSLSILNLRTKNDIDFSPLQKLRNEYFHLKLECYQEIDLSTLTGVEIDLLTLNYHSQVIDPLKTMSNDVSFLHLYLTVGSESYVKLDNISKNIMLLSISGALSELDLSSLEDAKTLSILKLDGLNIPNITLSDFSSDSSFYKEDDFQQIIIPKSIATRLHYFSLTNSNFKDFFSYPFAGSTCLRSIDFSGSTWNHMHLDEFCEIPSLAKVELDTNKGAYLDPEYVVDEKEIESPAMRDYQANIGFDSY